MKVKKTAALASNGVGFDTLPKELQDKLIGKTLNQAIAEGLVTDLGDDAGNLFAHSTQSEEWVYAIINGCRVTVSDKLTKTDPEEVKEMLGDLTFGGGISTVAGEGNGKYWFNLGLPRKTMLTANSDVNIAAFVAA
jgi:hypothetical protein